MESRKLISGAGNYFQGTDALEQIGPELKRQGRKRVLVIGGRRAMSAAGYRIKDGFRTSGLTAWYREFSGFCTAREVAQYGAVAVENGSDCILGVGGGKVMDLCKAAAAERSLAVYMVPTCAATCAAYAALSVLYDDRGCQTGTRYHADAVDGVFADTGVLSAAPPRYLAAGMADAMAKACEYSSMRRELAYGDVDVSKYFGYLMASRADEILLKIGPEAYAQARRGYAGNELEDAVFISIALTGIISGMGGFSGRTGSRFAIAHGFNEVIRGVYLADGRTWLHGEIVALGILAQLAANGLPEETTGRVRDFYRKIGLPVTLEEMGICLDEEEYRLFQKRIAEHSRVAENLYSRIFSAVDTVRGG